MTFVEAAPLDVGRRVGFVFGAAPAGAEVTEGLELSPHLRTEFFGGARVVRPAEIAQAVGVGLQVVEFLGGALAEAQVPERIIPFVPAGLEDVGLRGAGVRVEVTRLRVGARPAGRLRILEEEESRP